MRVALLIISFFILTFLKGQTLYWIGGSGNFNDRYHWSLNSGGLASNVVPGPQHELVFDENSGSSSIVINMVGANHIKSIKFLNENDIHITGNTFSSLRCAGDFILNSKTFWQANTKLIFESLNDVYNTINTKGNIIKSDVLIEKGNWNLAALKIDDQYTLKINHGSYKLNNTSLVVGNIESISGNVNFDVYKSTIHVKNKINLSEGNAFTSDGLILIAQKNNPLLYKINSNVNFGNDYKIIAPSPNACNIGYSFQNPTCNGLCDASMLITFDAGCNTGPYDLIFNTVATCVPPGLNGIMPPALSLPNICACGGNLMDIFVFDGVGFVTSLTNLNMPSNPTPINLNFTSNRQPNCFGQCNGGINITLTGGASPYHVFVNPSSGINFTVNAVSTTSVNNLCAGVQTFSVNDNNNCARTFTTLITQPATLVPNGVTTSVTCNGVCNGSAALSPTGGTSPYTYIWSASAGSSTNINVSNLCTGPVTATVTDTRSCVATFSANIAQPPPITLTVNRTNLICGALCDGGATVTASGGSGSGYSYTWTPNVSSGPIANGLCAGDYTVDVTDDLNCPRTVTFSITAPLTLTATSTQTNVLCNNTCTGRVVLTASGGTGAYTYSWSAPAVSSASVATNLCDGVYEYTVTDAVNCTYVNTVSITEPPAVTVSVTPTDITCFGSCNGQASASATGGVGAFTYTWSPGTPTGQGTASVTALCVGNYSVTVRDANNCSVFATTSISQPLDIVVNATSSLPTCNSLCNGSINANPTGGTAPFTFTLQPSSGSPIAGTVPFTGLCAGTYTLIVRDNLGCLKTQTVSLTQPNPLTLSLNTTSISCFNQCNASISTVVNGGTPGYSYSWNVGGTASSLVNQCTGVYSATVTDNAGCTATASVNITSPTDVTVSISPAPPTCNSLCNGVLTATAIGGTPNYTYTWSNGTTGNINSGRCEGSYTITVRDFLGCIKTQTVDLVAPPAITLTPVNSTVSCAGTCNGTVTVNPAGGTPNYVYSWNSVPTQTSQIASGLCPGNYIVTVTDNNGCTANTGVSVTQPPVLTSTISGVQSSCNVCIGAATANGIGGIPPYTYSWSDGQTTSSATNLCVGVQTVVVTDNSGCTSTSTVQIDQTIIILLTSNGNTLSCNGGCTGIATANASGGTGPGTYVFNWTPTNQSTQTATGLCAGSHTVLVTDGNGCSNSDVVTFQNPPAITLTVNQTNITCSGSANGSASASASGGTGVLSYLWQPGNLTTPTINNLGSGSYTVVVSDANNCSQSQVVTITESNSLTATFTNQNPTSCVVNDGSISFVPSGGLAPYTFTWNPGGSVNPLINLSDGNYVLTLRDNNNCIQTYTVSLSDPLGPTVTVTSNSINCFGLCTGSASLSITASTPGFSVNWSPNISNSTSVTGLCVGNYIAQVTDGNGCATNQTVNIAQPTQISSNGVSTNLNCNSVCNGAINITPSGGLSPYSYTWSPSGGNVEDPSNLCAGNYSVVIRDVNNCSVTNSFTITQPNPLVVNFNKRDVRCNGGCTGGARALVSGGQAPYSYSWTPVGAFTGAVVDTIVNLCTGIYSVSVRDANNCTITGTVSITEPTVLTSTVVNTNILCNAQCNGSATLTASGGTLPYSFSYNSSPVINNAVANTLCSGSYVGTVTDANGCISQRSFTVTQPLPIAITTTVSNPLCNAACNGSVSTQVTGGTPGYTYAWITAGGNAQNPTGLCAGSYTLTVTDNNACTSQTVVALTNPPSLLANLTSTNPICGTNCTGVVRANPIGGSPAYTYSWSTGATGQTINGLCAGSYSVTVRDLNNCSVTQSVNLIAPSLVAINPAITPAACGSNNGAIDAVAIGGNAPFSYTWSPPVPLAQISNTVVTGIPAGVYTVVVSDVSACTATAVIALSNSNGPTAATITSSNVACNGDCNGSAVVSNPVGGTAPYVLSWVNPAVASATITNLCVGGYTAQITDDNNCILFQSATISQPQLIDDNEVLSSATCAGNCNGQIALSPSGGNGGYTYLWSNGQNTSSVGSLCPGNYSVTITDTRNCTFTTNYNLPSLVTITSGTMATNNVCFDDCNGTLLAAGVSGGLPPYTFTWSDPLGQTTPTAIGLCNGNYSVTIRDANGCFNAVSADITSPTKVSISSNVTQPSCNSCDGAVSVTPSGGTPIYTLVWSNGQSGTSISNLCAGIFDVLITDGNGCSADTSVIINSISGFTSETITKTDVTCSNLCNGSVTITAVGGTAPVSYFWPHDNSTTQSLTGLCPGVYFCNMTDLNGCVRTASVVINSATTISLTTQVFQTSCASSTGSISTVASGGTGVITYNWLPIGTGTGTLVTNLAAGIYTVTATDVNGCLVTDEFSLGSINGPVITGSVNNVSCSGVCNGSIQITINGGNPGYTTLWSNSANTTSITNICEGSYSVSVTDALGCIAVENFSVSGSPSILFSAPSINEPLCFGDCNGSITALPIGGTLPYTFSWSPSASSTTLNDQLCAGNYTLNVTDANGCVISQSYTLTTPSVITLSANVTDASCSTVMDGSIDISIAGGSPAYTYTWSNTEITEDITNVLPGTYSVSIIDLNGCRKDSAFIVNPAIIVDAIAGNDTTFCQGGSLILDGNNSIGGSTYQWIELPSGSIISNTTIVTVNPNNGTTTFVLVVENGLCVDRDTINITSNPLPNVDAGPFVTIPVFTSTVIGGSPTAPSGSSITWLPTLGLDDSNASNPVSSTTITTIYTVSVVDANGCRNTDTVTVYILPEIRIPNGFSPNGDGKNDTWILDLIYLFPNCEIEVYNRWGEQLFYSKGYNTPFNGQYKGKDLPVGTYYYIINLNDPKYPKPFTGPLTIFR